MIFTEEQELSIVDEILGEYICKNRLFNSVTFLTIVHRHAEELGIGFDRAKFSTHFIHDFKKRHKLSSRRFHLRRRDRANSSHDTADWVDKITDLLNTVPHEYIINCDETAWRVVPNGLLTWAPVGADGVSVGLNASDKESITVLASITAARTKLPLQFIAKGRTVRAERNQLGDIEYHETTHSESGWTTTATFLLYLQWLRARYGPGPELHLILDLYSVHRSDQVKAEAARLGIRLYFIPAGFTDELQPLDRYIFGVLKAMCRRMFHRFTEDVQDTVRKPDAAEFMVRAWEQVDENVMRKAWGIYEEPYDDAEPTQEDIFMDDADEDRIDEDQRLLNDVIALFDADTDE
jgi:hypothetical protein